MTFIRRNKFEGGTDGTAFSRSSSGAGSQDPFDVIVVNNVALGATATDPNVTWSASSAIFGSLGAKLILSASTTYLRWDMTIGATDQPRFVARVGFKFQSLPSANTDLIMKRTGSGATQLDILTRTAAGKIAVKNNAGTIVSGTTGTYVMTAGTKYIVEFATTVSTTTGNYQWRLYDATGTTMLDSYNGPGNLNLGSAMVDSVRFGNSTTASGWTQEDLDDVAFLATNDSAAWIGNSVTPPTAVLSFYGPFYLLDGTASNGSLPITGYTLSEVTASGTPALTLEGGVTMPQGSWLIAPQSSDTTWKLNVTDSGGGTSATPDQETLPAFTAGAAPSTNLVKRFKKISGTWQ